MNRQALLAALSIAAPALGDDGTALPVLSHFCFEGDTLYAFNDIVCVVVGFETGLNLGLHGATLLGVLKATRSEEVEVKVKGSVATITGAGKSELPVLPAADFIFNIPDEEELLSSALGEEIRKGIEACLVSVAADSLRPEYNGVTLRITKTGVQLFSTDNVSATRVELKGKLAGRKEAALVLPKLAAELLLKLFSKEGTPRIRVTEKIAIVEFGGEPSVTLITKLLGTPSGKFDKVFADHEPKVLCELPEGIESEIEKALVLTARDSPRECFLMATVGELVVSAGSVKSLGKMKSSLKLAEKKLIGAANVNPEYVKRALPFADKFALNDERSLVFVDEAIGLTHIIAVVSTAKPAAEEDSTSGK